MNPQDSLNTQVLPNDRRDLWNEFVSAHPCGDVLQTTRWADLKASSGWTSQVIAAMSGDTIRAGALLLRRALPGGFGLYYAPRGPVADPNDAESIRAVSNAAREVTARGKGILLKVDPPWEEEESASTLNSCGFRPVGGEGGFAGTQPKCVMQLDLQRPLDEIMAGFHQKWRYNIRLAERKGITVRASDKPQDLITFYRLLRLTAERDGFLVRGESYFERMWDCLSAPGWIRLFLGEYEGEAVCGALLYVMGDKCWYTYGASGNAHREKMPNYLMQWKMISFAHELGCRWYDFRGVSCTPDDPNDKTAGLNRFKSGFSPRLVRYIGEFDLPVNKPASWLWTKGLPYARSWMRRGAKTFGPPAD